MNVLDQQDLAIIRGIPLEEEPGLGALTLPGFLAEVCERFGPREALATRAVHLRDVNWIGEGDLADLPPEGREIAVRLRSTRPPAPALLQRDAQGRAVVELAALEAGVSPGQACVFYESAEPLARVLGGGFIVATDMVAPLISNPDAQAAASV